VVEVHHGVREFFQPSTAWDTACWTHCLAAIDHLDAPLNHAGGQILRDTQPHGPYAIEMQAADDAIGLARLHLSDPHAWRTTDVNWWSAPWRDAMLLEATAPLLEWLSEKSGFSWATPDLNWAGTRSVNGEQVPAKPAQEPERFFLTLKWATPDEERALALSWNDLAAGLSFLRRLGMVIDDHAPMPQVFDEASPSFVSGGCTSEHGPLPLLRLTIAELKLSLQEWASIQVGGGLVLPAAADTEEMPLCLQFQQQWALLGYAGAVSGKNEASDHYEVTSLVGNWLDPSTLLPAPKNWGALEEKTLTVFTRGRPLTPNALLAFQVGMQLPVPIHHADLYLNGFLVGHGVIRSRQNQRVLHITEWAP
jgi:hypothetical protein